MPATMSDFVWFLLVAGLGVTATLVGIVYKGIDGRLEDHDKRIRNLELTISFQLQKIMHKLGVE